MSQLRSPLARAPLADQISSTLPPRNDSQWRHGGLDEGTRPEVDARVRCAALRCAALCSSGRRRCACAKLNISGGPLTLAAICEVTMQIPMFSYSPRPSQRRRARDIWSLALLCFPFLAFCRRIRRGGDSHASQHMTPCGGSGDCGRQPGVFIQPLPSRNGIPVAPSTRPENAS